jgi:uncharacterized protein (DUF2235 family)
MPRNLVLCFDGTDNQFGPCNTNVVRLFQSLERNPDRQLGYYDPGVGTMPEPNVASWIGKRLSEIWGLAFGAGLVWKVEEAYTWLMDNWERGDQVFIFGFSRGAYSARVLAGLLHALGLLPRGGHNMVPYAAKLFGAIRRGNDPRGSGAENADPKLTAYWQLCDEFRWTFARPAHDGDDERRFPTHFLGLWDTVSSVGWVWDPVKFQFTARNPSVRMARHAISIDERRAFFRQNRLGKVDGQDLKQIWFPGVHCDVGGGYPLIYNASPLQYSRLWQRPFLWIVKESQTAGLLIDPTRLEKVLSACPATSNGWVDPQHDSLTPLWELAEYFPKLRYDSVSKTSTPYLNRGRYRDIPEGEFIDEWTIRRIRDTAYAPPNLSASFCDAMRQLPPDQIPGCVPYTP